ncbi:MAG: 16S rRNA (guanine(527)-N(7))-methyltransferase RsmG [Clostridia bacterium]|nr:16S rRNA (guanine(527)-N(7))-methyltransferase RsmG [Clostridia bacterium]
MIDINDQSFKSKLAKVFSENGMSSYLSLEKSEKFLALTKRMLEENEKYNLTAITDPDKIILAHYADCAAIASKFKKGATVVDVGCGAGFPTLPLAIVRDDLKILALDSTAKRINYVSETARMLGLANVTAAVSRAEDAGLSPEYREKFDYATARAVAELRVLTELCLPLVRLGGQMIAMKGKNAEFELSGAKRAIATLGGRDPRYEQIKLTSSGDEPLTHPLIIIDKREHTPKNYPRPFAQISKKPL